jgi:murein DD-endopeptidase MepM/ murein hydrolase activator NlpD
LKKHIHALMAVLVAVSIIFLPVKSYAGPKEDIDRELAKLKQQETETAKQRAAADKLASNLKTQKNQETVNLKDLMQSIDQQAHKLNDLNVKVSAATTTVKQTSSDLENAENRVSERDKLLKSRLRFMYMNGTVSYWEVLLSATSFSDFLDRYQSLKTIVEQDKSILEANKQDRDLIVVKKKEVQQQLDQVKSLFNDTQIAKASLEKQEKQKEVVIASLSAKEKDAEELSDEHEQNLVLMAKQKALLFTKKNEILQQEELARQRAAAAAAAASAKKKGGAAQVANVGGGKLQWPVPFSSTITSTFGYRVDPIKGVSKLHKGIDIGAPNGSTINAAESGTVLIASWVTGYGNTVVIDHGNGMWTWYGHIRNGGTNVSEGDFVKRGQKIAEVGSTGDSTGNHLHFEVRIHEEAVNPMPYLK